MISNWSNNFAKFDYLSHAWDAKVSNYKDGVGYNDSLKVSTVKDLDTELGTSISIYGYKKSENTPDYHPDKHFSFLRYDEQECYVVVCNFSDKPASMKLNIPNKGIVLPLEVEAFSYTIKKIN